MSDENNAQKIEQNENSQVKESDNQPIPVPQIKQQYSNDLSDMEKRKEK